MDSIMNKFQLAERRYSDELKKDKEKEYGINTKGIKNKTRKLKELKKTIKSIIIITRNKKDKKTTNLP